MPRPSLSENAAKRKGEKLAQKTVGAAKSVIETASNLVDTTKKPRKRTTSNASIPTLKFTTPNKVEGQLPQFNPQQYQVSDPLSPPKSMPQVTQSQFVSASRIYDGGMRALQLTGKAFDLTRERFVVEGKKAKTFSAGVQTATAFEKVKGDLTDYQIQLQNNQQKKIELGTAKLRTTTVQSIAVETEKELSEKLAQAQAGAELAQLQTQEKQTKLAEFKLQLTPQV
ncbi:MAG: hypothetical protein F6K47_43540 [Symploca sp. SIO2E6]|nr:hypothetical protein [Symploca sp. SIO1A3]NET62724.1 hypothetical protein [Symploca sp. SIO2E6]